jgi:hypothetical protein
MDLSLYHFPDDSVHVSRLIGQDTSVMQFNTIAQVYAVFSRDGLLRMVDTNMLVMLFSPHLNQLPSLFDVHLSTFARDAVYT